MFRRSHTHAHTHAHMHTHTHTHMHTHTHQGRKEPFVLSSSLASAQCCTAGERRALMMARQVGVWFFIHSVNISLKQDCALPPSPLMLVSSPSSIPSCTPRSYHLEATGFRSATRSFRPETEIQCTCSRRTMPPRQRQNNFNKAETRTVPLRPIQPCNYIYKNKSRVWHCLQSCLFRVPDKCTSRIVKKDGSL